MVFLMGLQKSGISMVSLQPMLGVPGYKTIWTMRHEIGKAMTDRDAYFKLARLIEAARRCCGFIRLKLTLMGGNSTKVKGPLLTMPW
jgi:hypothetical protein